MSRRPQPPTPPNPAPDAISARPFICAGPQRAPSCDHPLDAGAHLYELRLGTGRLIASICGDCFAQIGRHPHPNQPQNESINQ